MTLVEARKELKLTQKQIAAQLRIKQAFISQIEQEKRPCPAYILKRVMQWVGTARKERRAASKSAMKSATYQLPKKQNISIRDIPEGYVEYAPGSCRIKEEHRCVLDGCRSHCPFVPTRKIAPGSRLEAAGE
jgi:transcriptional regulator with XRE-family HTH domain